MYCSNCRKELREGAKFCSFCGTTVNIKDEEITEKAVTEEISAVTEEAADEKAYTQQESAAEEIAAENKEEIKADSPEFTEKFKEEDGLFVVREQPADISSVTVFKEKKKFPWVKVSVAVVCAAAIGVSAYIIPTTVIPAIKYSNAQKLFESGDYQGAETAFEALGNYKESSDYIIRCRYGEAEQLFNNGKYPEAADAFTALNGYSDSDARAAECMVCIAESFISVGDYDAAMSVYAAAGKPELAEQTALKKIEALAADGKYFEAAEIAENYCSEDVVTEYLYQGALAAKNAGDNKTAADTFYKLGDYNDSAALAEECTYSFYMSEYTQNGASEEVVRGFYFLGKFRNSHDMFLDASYQYGLECEENKDYAAAAAMFRNCGTYKTSMDELYKSRYNLGKDLLNRDPASARSVFALLSTYGDSAEQKKIAASRLSGGHEDWYADGYTSVGEYYTTVFRKSDTLLISCTAGTETISSPITLVLTLSDSNGTAVTADCENVRNSGSFNGSFALSSMASGDAQITIARKDNGTVLRTINITITD
ncbi:MAG: zinc-ribbon domain-containing protein [Oscillospiraceae bacterium]|nr:zinc-ribbon domain-containing protein [Oscillospiraceae bacterium]